MPDRKIIILVADAEPQTLKILEIALDPAGTILEGCGTGKEAVRRCISLNPDLVLLDLDLPDMQGSSVISSLRAWSQAPIIVVTARAADCDLVDALNRGADDYVVKPFNIDVLEARIAAALRKIEQGDKGEPELLNGPLRMDLARHQVYLQGKPVSFTPKEYDLLRYFLVHRGKMLTHKQLLREVWGGERGEDARYLRVFICKIREKIEAVAKIPPLIVTRPGLGYQMEILDEPESRP